MSHSAAMKIGERRHDIDWLRTLASYFVVIYHTAQFFDYQEKTYIKNGELSRVIDVFTRFVHIWHMPLFFLLAGWSTKASLGRRGAWAFLLARAQKLVIPLLVGLFFWCALPQWIALKHGLFKTSSGERRPAQPSISFTSFLKEYYYSGEGITWGHLWFLAYLFTFTALYLPGFLLLSRVGFVEKWFHGWGGWVLANAPVIPLVMVQVNLRDRWPGYYNLTDDWANFWFYSTFFITGFLFGQYPVLESHLHSRRKMNLVAGVFSSFFCLLPFLSLGSYQFNSLCIHIFSATGAWYMVLSFFSYGRSAFSGSAPSPFWARHAFPVYIVHDVPLALLADSLLGSLRAPIFVKFVILATSALVLSLLIVRRRSGLLPVLVGMEKERSIVLSTKKVD